MRSGDSESGGHSWKAPSQWWCFGLALSFSLLCRPWTRRCSPQEGWNLGAELRKESISRGHELLHRASKQVEQSLSGAGIGEDGRRDGREGQGLEELAWEMWYGGNRALLSAGKASITTSLQRAAFYHHHAQGLIFSEVTAIPSFTAQVCAWDPCVLEVHTDAVRVEGCLCAGLFRAAMCQQQLRLLHWSFVLPAVLNPCFIVLLT